MKDEQQANFELLIVRRLVHQLRSWKKALVAPLIIDEKTHAGALPLAKIYNPQQCLIVTKSVLRYEEN